jgi:hypothetical protein
MPDEPVSGAEPAVPLFPAKMPEPISVQEAMQAAETAVAEAVAGMKHGLKVE